MVKEPVVFSRIFMFTTGIITILSGLFATGLTLMRLLYAPATIQLNRSVLVILSLMFVLGYLLSGVCWIMAAMSRRIWNSIS
jgi:cytochrome bd-type quinol oxidase subunit 1